MVYLLHFEKKFKIWQHYIGFTRDLEQRIKTHRAGRGARLVKQALAAGIDFKVAATWEGDQRKERELKKKKASSLCPICKKFKLSRSG